SRDKEPSPRSRCARSLRSALRREREERCAALGFHPLRHEGGRDEVAGGWRCGTKNPPLGRAARVRFAPPFGAKGKRRAQPSAFTPFGTKGVATKSRGDGVAGQRTIPSVALRAFASLRPSARKGRDVRSPRLSPPSARRGSRRSRGGMALRDKEPSPRSRCARVRFAPPFACEGERDVRSPRLSPPSARKGKETCAALGFHPLLHERGGDVRSLGFHPLRHEGGRDEV